MSASFALRSNVPKSLSGQSSLGQRSVKNSWKAARQMLQRWHIHGVEPSNEEIGSLASSRGSLSHSSLGSNPSVKKRLSTAGDAEAPAARWSATFDSLKAQYHKESGMAVAKDSSRQTLKAKHVRDVFDLPTSNESPATHRVRHINDIFNEQTLGDVDSVQDERTRRRQVIAARRRGIHVPKEIASTLSVLMKKGDECVTPPPITVTPCDSDGDENIASASDNIAGDNDDDSMYETESDYDDEDYDEGDETEDDEDPFIYASLLSPRNGDLKPPPFDHRPRRSAPE